jgi:hypothetical protein
MTLTFAEMSSVARADSRASSLTSLATTAKPLPASPARAASMVALRASRLVCHVGRHLLHPVEGGVEGAPELVELVAWIGGGEPVTEVVAPQDVDHLPQRGGDAAPYDEGQHQAQQRDARAPQGEPEPGGLGGGVHVVDVDPGPDRPAPGLVRRDVGDLGLRGVAARLRPVVRHEVPAGSGGLAEFDEDGPARRVLGLGRVEPDDLGVRRMHEDPPVELLDPEVVGLVVPQTPERVEGRGLGLLWGHRARLGALAVAGNDLRGDVDHCLGRVGLLLGDLVPDHPDRKSDEQGGADQAQHEEAEQPHRDADSSDARPHGDSPSAGGAFAP